MFLDNPFRFSTDRSYWTDLSSWSRTYYESFGMEFELCSGVWCLKDFDAYDFINYALLPTNLEDYSLEYYLQCSSTLDCYRLGQKRVYWADYQTHSRGQQGRIWKSVFGQQLLLSIVMPSFYLPFHALFPISSLLKTLLVYNPNLRYKWPNDLYSGDQKIAGVLIQNHREWLVLSIGLNTTYADPSAQIGPLFADRRHRVSRCNLLKQILANLNLNHCSQDHTSSEALSEMLTSYHLYTQGSSISFQYPDGTIQHGIFQGLSSKGGLCVQFAQGQYELYSGRLLKNTK